MVWALLPILGHIPLGLHQKFLVWRYSHFLVLLLVHHCPSMSVVSSCCGAVAPQGGGPWGSSMCIAEGIVEGFSLVGASVGAAGLAARGFARGIAAGLADPSHCLLLALGSDGGSAGFVARGLAEGFAGPVGVIAGGFADLRVQVFAVRAIWGRVPRLVGGLVGCTAEGSAGGAARG